jgi:hypothetical protein
MHRAFTKKSNHQLSTLVLHYDQHPFTVYATTLIGVDDSSRLGSFESAQQGEY